MLSGLVSALVACSAFGGPGSSPKASATATTQATSTPIPTPFATQVVRLEHPIGGTDVVLRMDSGGGLVPLEYFVAHVPQFTLYGDGTAVFKPLAQGNPIAFDEPSAAYLTIQLTEDEVQDLLNFALKDGGLAGVRETYMDQTVADGSTTLFTIDAGDYNKSVTVYALLQSTNSGSDQVDRERMGRLALRLSEFASEANSYGTVRPYDPEKYRVTLFEQSGAAPASAPVAWPWPDLTPDDFTASDEPGASRVMSRDDVKKLTSVPTGGLMGLWVKTRDGKTVEVAVRPLLPDEIAAAS